MRNAIIAAIVAAIISAGGGYAAGINTEPDYRQDAKIANLQAKVRCLNRANFELVHLCLYYTRFGPR